MSHTQHTRPPRVTTCPITGCSNTRIRSHAMCRGCWAQVPADLQRALYRAYSQRSAPGGYARHLQAVEDARASVEGREPEELFGD